MQKQIAFGGFVLLSTKEFDKNEILLNLRMSFGIRINPDTVKYEENENMIKFEYEDMICMMVYSPSRLEDKVMLKRAELNYTYKNAVHDCDRHIAHILIGVAGGKSHIQSAIMFTKLASSCLNVPNAISIYCTHNVIEAQSYVQESDVLNEDFLPIENWIYVGFLEKKDEKSGKSLWSSYTVGMNLFDQKELEIIDSVDDFDTISIKKKNIAYYILDNGIIFTQDEEITLSEKDENGNVIPQKFTVKISKSKNIKQKYSLKIEKN